MVALAAVGIFALIAGRGSAVSVTGAAAPGTKTVNVDVTDVAFVVNPTAASWGRVTSNPPGIDCPGDCMEDFPRLSTVELTVTPTPGNVFEGWGVFGNDAGPNCDKATVCSLTIGDDDQVAFVSAALRPEAQLSAIPEGAGSLTIDPAETGRPSAPCTVEIPVFDPLPLECTPRYTNGTRVTVNAVPDQTVPGARFVRWSDFNCGRSSSCTRTMRGDRDLSAFFTPVYLTVAGGSFGAVTLPPPGGVCTFQPDPVTGVEDPCQVPYPLDSVVTLRRDPAAAQNPGDEWTGSCTGAGATCTLRMRKNEFVRAGADPSLDIPTRVGLGLRVVYRGRRGGKIALVRLTGSGPRREVCRRSCRRAGYRRGDMVLIRAKGARRARFSRWADIRSGASTRAVQIGRTSEIKAVFRRRR